MTPTRLTDATDALAFMMAGNAYMTLRSAKTGTRYTYRVRASKDKQVHFVSVLYGSDNVGDYRWIGIIKNGEFKVPGKTKMMPDDPRVVAFMWTHLHLTTKHQIPSQLEVWHEGRCGKCGRLLTVPESIANGIGPECAKKFKAEQVS
jgi:hypothetical protein